MILQILRQITVIMDFLQPDWTISVLLSRMKFMIFVKNAILKNDAV